jgi:hypothetical protein
MKHLLLFSFLIYSLSGIAQLTYVPDDDFENYIETNFPAADNGVANDDSVITAGVVGISQTTFFFSVAENITDFTGIQDFTALAKIQFYNSPIQNIDLSTWNVGNINMSDPNWWAFDGLYIEFANCSLLETIIMPQGNIGYYAMSGDMPNLSSVEFQTSNHFVQTVDITLNAPNLSVLDFSITSGYTFVQMAINSDFTCILLDNGQCDNLWLVLINDTDLSNGEVCVRVDDPVYSNANWSGSVTYSADCASCMVGIEEVTSKPKSLLRITDILGREAVDQSNTQLIHYYSDGSFERKYRLE